MAEEGWGGVSDAGQPDAAGADAEGFAGAVERNQYPVAPAAPPLRPTAVRKRPADAAIMAWLKPRPIKAARHLLARLKPGPSDS
jgi:hypothetical protein